jgi:hypothetical protein
VREIIISISVKPARACRGIVSPYIVMRVKKSRG